MIAGNDVSGTYSTVKDVIDNMQKTNLHYFYMLQMPECGGFRIKLGKSKALISRFKYYQAHFHKDTIRIKKLIGFSPSAKRYIDGKALELYSLFEREAMKWLRNNNKHETISTEEGRITEWFDADTENQLMKDFQKIYENWQKSDYFEVSKREQAQRKAKNQIKVGDRIEVKFNWTDGRTKWYAGKVINKTDKKFKVKYDDGDEYTHEFDSNTIFRKTNKEQTSNKDLQETRRSSRIYNQRNPNLN